MITFEERIIDILIDGKGVGKLEDTGSKEFALTLYGDDIYFSPECLRKLAAFVEELGKK